MKNGINLIRQDVPSAVISLSQRTMAALIVLVLAAAMCAPAARAQLVIEDVQRRVRAASDRIGCKAAIDRPVPTDRRLHEALSRRSISPAFEPASRQSSRSGTMAKLQRNRCCCVSQTACWTMLQS